MDLFFLKTSVILLGILLELFQGTAISCYVSDKCATVYDGTNQSGSSADLPVGKFNAYFPGINPYNQMPLGDRTESVTVIEGTGFTF